MVQLSLLGVKQPSREPTELAAKGVAFPSWDLADEYARARGLRIPMIDELFLAQRRGQLLKPQDAARRYWCRFALQPNGSRFSVLVSPNWKTLSEVEERLVPHPDGALVSAVQLRLVRSNGIADHTRIEGGRELEDRTQEKRDG